ncbi:serine/threonine-protein kinase [Actinocorallia populi]|uniref:serine/threonine-protein kinase n=1 Tax=Actinocorallia populi TaxID=2079200 RepID=UPI000D0888F0|nr:serine/threonine-protein kinase [Actinocorallia populi]
MGVVGTWRVPGYDEVRELSSGSQGRTVLVRHHSSGKPYVIKYLTSTNPATRRRFEEESSLIQQIFSPYVARWYGHLDQGPVAAILLEAVDGVPLRDVLTWHGHLSPEAALAVLKRSLLGLQEAHSRGIVHRDCKPANIVVRRNGLSKLVGFGVGTLAGERRHPGTPAYKAPEQWLNASAVPATDVYAVTCVFFECLTGRPPLGAAKEAHLSEPVPLDHVPEPLHDLVLSGLAKSLLHRPSSAAGFAADLERRATSLYGPEWERHGITLLGGLAGSLAPLLPEAEPDPAR